MITTLNVREMLNTLGFHLESPDLFVKSFPVGCTMEVDFQNRRLVFPPQIEGRERNDTFDKPENFVVFECVCRLLEKGYRPEHIELEKEWHLGHDAKGGRADICVYDRKRQGMLFIVECKTWGKEFDKAWKDTNSDGGQVFSYWQQERSCQWLIVYASDYGDNGIVFKAPTIHCVDDANIVKMAKRDKSIELYANATTAQELFSVWNTTYGAQIYEGLVFSDDTIAYKIGIKPLRKRDLRDFTPDDKIVNRFEEILRHNNVSDKENAFNRLVALFICKLVDEITKGDEDEVEFQYKQGTDDYETLQDRLQRLHQQGMKDFMEEEIFYVSNDYAEKLFSTYTGSTRKQAIEDLQNTIRILKFYSNNDFAFKDVHNEELFYQNGKILVEVVQLFQEYRIVYPSKHQFLGDLFEQLLNKGFKQNEGQFFTPMPITRFIWDSLPIQQIVHTEKGYYYPKVVDYACGAGHFLTEAIEAINAAIGLDSATNEWVRDSIFGIEKDYRLARVSKISLFMNGAGQGNIIFGDGLENAPDKGIDNGKFDILVANPPYSVSGFKEHLQLSNNTFSLLDSITNNGSEIEVLFVERIAQLLKPKGIAAVILPSSILSNDSASYTGAREQILQNFKIRAIVQLGSKTFSATGTNTVILFLEKYDEPPKRVQLVQDSIDAIFNGAELSEWEDQQIFEGYCARIDVTEEQYRAFLGKCAVEDLAEIGHFQPYIDAFEKTKKKGDFYSFVFPIEKEKMSYYAMTYQQETLIIVAPSDNAGQKEFLGYDWSNRKGNEGIQINTPGGKMFNPNDRTSEGTLAHAIKKSFEETLPILTEEQRKYANIVSTMDTLDFSRALFSKAVRTYTEAQIIITSRYSVIPLGTVVVINRYSANPMETPDKEYTYIDIDAVEKGTGEINFTKSIKGANAPSRARRIAHKNSIIISTVRPNLRGFAFLKEEPDNNTVFSTGFAIIEVLDENVLLPYYLYLLFQNSDVMMQQMVAKMGRGQYPSVNEADIRSLRIPLPPTSIQQQIIDECSKIDEEYNTTRMSIGEYRKKIEDLFDALDVTNRGGYRHNLLNSSEFEITIGKRVLNNELVIDGAIPVFSANVTEPFGYTDKLLITDFSRDSVLWGIDGDWMVNFWHKNQPFYPTDHCGVLRVLTDKINPRYMAYLLEKEGKRAGFSRSYRASIDRVQGLSVTVPDIEIQNSMIEKVLEYENRISDLEQSVQVLSGKRDEILKQYLQ